MNGERVESSLRFVGDWPWWIGVLAACLLGGTAWFVYRREVRPLRWWLRWLLPSLRALAVVMLVLMLSGPVLHHRKVIGQLSRLLLFVDGSQSMDLTDSAMSAARKILILHRLKLLPADAIPVELPEAAQALADAERLAETAAPAEGLADADWKRLASNFSAKIDEARALLGKSPGGIEQLNRFDIEMSGPAKDLATREATKADDRARVAQDLGRLGKVARRWQEALTTAFDKAADQLTAGNADLRTALQTFDALPRWQRLQALLLKGDSPSLLSKLAEKHDVELIELKGPEARSIWRPSARDSALPTALPTPSEPATNLGTGLKTGVAGVGNEPRGAALVFSDGQHNHGESPIEVARLYAGRQTPIFTVGMGSEARPRDLAVAKVEGPESVFYQDRVRGEVTLKDDLPPGEPFTLSIVDGEKVLWEQQLVSEGKQLRKVPFDFALKETVETKLGAVKDAGVQISGVPIELKVRVSAVEGDREPGNNEAGLRLRAVTQKRRILIVDGRPRWETRYLRNLFDRDEQWEVNAVFAGSRPGGLALARGDQPEQFPTDSALLEPYDLIVFGDVPRDLWKGDELEWIRDFVGERGGAIVFIDGPRDRLRDYAKTPLASLLPVEWKGAGVREGIARLTLSERSTSLAPFFLVPDRLRNTELWRLLPAPHWLSGAIPLAGAEALVEVEVNGQKQPAIVHRTFGAGRVLYQAFDDSWRWRYEVADQYHVKYWNQLANWMAELPFAVRDKFVSLDAGAITYRPGESADIRVRLRDGEGKPVTNTAVDAALFRNGQKVATIRLATDGNGGGLFRGKTAALEPGEHEVGVESVAIAERDTRARTSFKVEAQESGELTALHLNEELLRQMADLSGGRYLPEENAHLLPELLAPMSAGRVEETDTVLWQSYWWFLPIVLLLTVEWVIRKRVGLL